MGSHEFAAESVNGLNGTNGLYGTNGFYGVNGLNGVNGLYGTNGIAGVNGISGTNGLSGANGIMGTNGISGANGLNGVNGLSETSGLMTTDAGRKTVAYLVRCALASNDTLVKRDQMGTEYTFNGGLGLCPAWKTGGIATNRTCQNMVSACMMAHINTSGVHVPLWIDSESTAIGWGVSPSYPKQEGTFFGNIIMTGNLSGLSMPNVNAPVAYFCEGAGISAGVVAGRLTSGATNVPYTNPYGQNVKCVNSSQTTAGPTSAGQTAPDGFKVACANNYCFQNGEPLTVWRNPSYTPVFDAVYAYTLAPMSASGKSLDISGPKVQQLTTASVDAQRIKLAPDTVGHWKMTSSTDTTKCIGPVGGSMVSGVNLEVQACDGTANQGWDITADANTGGFVMKSGADPTLCLEVTDSSGSDGALMRAGACGSGNNQKFKVGSGYGSAGSGGSGGSGGTGGSGGSGGSTPTFNSASFYRMVPQQANTKSIDVSYGSTNNGTPVQQYGTWNTDGQKFAILASGSNWKIAMKANTNKCFGPANNGTGNGTTIQIQDCNGSNYQAWTAGLIVDRRLQVHQRGFWTLPRRVGRQHGGRRGDDVVRLLGRQQPALRHHRPVATKRLALG